MPAEADCLPCSRPGNPLWSVCSLTRSPPDRPSYCLTFAPSNCPDLLLPSMAVFKVHLWGTHRLSVPGNPSSSPAWHPAGGLRTWTSRDAGWGAGGVWGTSAPTWLQDDAGHRLLDPVAQPGWWPGAERHQPWRRGVLFGLGPSAHPGQLRICQQLLRFLSGAAGRERWRLSVQVSTRWVDGFSSCETIAGGPVNSLSRATICHALFPCYPLLRG